MTIMKSIVMKREEKYKNTRVSSCKIGRNKLHKITS